MAAPTWRITYSNFAGTNYCELDDISERKFAFPLLAARTVRGKVPLRSNGGVNLMSNGGEGLLKLWQDDVLRMTCELTSIEVIGSQDEKSVAFVGTETMWPRLSTRLVGNSATGAKVTTATDKGAYLVIILAALNSSNDTGLTATYTASATFTGGPWRYKPYTELMLELAQTLNGFEWKQEPLDPASGGKTGNIVFAPRIGSSKPTAIFEYGYGTKANLREYRWIVNSENLGNIFYSVPADYPDTGAGGVLASVDFTSLVDRGQRDRVIESDLVSTGARQALIDQHKTLRAAPRQTFEFQPAIDDGAGRVPEFGVDYETGDTITGRVQDEGVLMLDANVRVYNAEIDIDANGQQTTTLTVIRE